MAKKRPIVYNVVIEGRKFREAAEFIRGEPGNRLTFVFHNEDNTDWDVHILSIAEKETGLSAMPLVHPIGPGHAVTANKKDATVLRQRIETAFAKGSGLPFTSYKFTLRLTDKGGGGIPEDLDPDLDVAPPS